MVYNIYEIPGKKIGCTAYLNRRQKESNDKGKLIVLETHKDIYVASDRELVLQAEKGYKVDPHPYWYVVKVKGERAKSKEAQKKRLENYDWEKAKIARFTNPNYDPQKHVSKTRSIYQLDLQGNIINKFDRIKYAAEAVGGSRFAIGECLAGRTKTSAGYKWEYTL